MIEMNEILQLIQNNNFKLNPSFKLYNQRHKTSVNQIINIENGGIFTWQTCCLTTAQTIKYLFDAQINDLENEIEGNINNLENKIEDNISIAYINGLLNYDLIEINIESDIYGFHLFILLNHNNESFVIQSFANEYYITINKYNNISQILFNVLNNTNNNFDLFNSELCNNINKTKKFTIFKKYNINFEKSYDKTSELILTYDKIFMNIHYVCDKCYKLFNGLIHMYSRDKYLNYYYCSNECKLACMQTRMYF